MPIPDRGYAGIRGTRRPVLIAACAVLLAGIGTPLGAQVAPLVPAPVASRPMAGEFTFAAVGDLVYLRPMLETIERQSPGLVRLLREADVTFGNFETMAFDLRSFSGSPQAQSGGTWLVADPGVTKDIRAMGFDVVSLANNHSTDWGVEGLAETERLLTDAGLIHAGTGHSLQAARAPRYLDLPGGRVALVSAASTITPMSRAADPLGEVPGRAGLNPLRVQAYAHVTKAQLDVLAQVAATIPAFGPRPTDYVDILGSCFREGPLDRGEMAFSYELNGRDEAGNLLAVRQAKQNGNFAVFTLHNHEPANETDVPPDFAITIAHKAIDAGADAYVGHGPHILRGIEIYKGKPIFYSLGNFAMMNNSLDAVPRDMYEQYGVEPGSATVPEMLAARGKRFFADPRLYQSVIAVSRYANGKLKEVRLYPIELGINDEGAGRGVPRMADAVTARRILEMLQSLSKPFGTAIEIRHGVGVIKLR